MTDTLRLITYNIHGGIGRDRKHDYTRINRFLDEYNVDVALLQEVETRPENRKTEQDIDDLCGRRFPHYVAAPAMLGPHGWYGNAVLSRYPILDQEIVDLSYPGREPRNLIDAYIDTPQGLLRVMNTHKGLKRAERSWQLEKIYWELQETPEIPLIFGGDFNEWQPIFSSIRLLNIVLHAHRTAPTWPVFKPLLHLDRLWSRPADLIRQVGTVKTEQTRLYSDHLPVLADISAQAMKMNKKL